MEEMAHQVKWLLHTHTRIRIQIPRAHKKAGCVRTPRVISVYSKANSWTSWIWELWLQWESLLQGMNSRIKRLLMPISGIHTPTYSHRHIYVTTWEQICMHAPHIYMRNKLLLYYDRILNLLYGPEKQL